VIPIDPKENPTDISHIEKSFNDEKVLIESGNSEQIAAT
jgi:hypothetical protein